MTKAPIKNRCAEFLSPFTILFLKLGLFGLSLQTAALFIVVQDAMTRDPYYVSLYYLPFTEYVVLSAFLIMLGVVVFEIMARDIQKNSRC